MTRLLIVGPPGAGKGSQAALLARELRIPAISTGDIFREHVKNRTSLGLRVDAIIGAGDYVSDELTNELVMHRLSASDAAFGFILDGYPRTVPQVRELDVMLDGIGARLDAVIHLTAGADDLVDRLLQRGVDAGRSDDTASTILHRINVYEELTDPIVEIYRQRGQVVAIDGLGTMPEVNRNILAALVQKIAQ